MRVLGKTGLEINDIGFGGIPIQRIDGTEVISIIDEMESRGLNFIDTARGYTVSEEYLGNSLIGRRDKFIIATKSMSRDYEGMKRDIDISLTLLKTDYIDLYQCHNVNEKDDITGALKALKEAKEIGKIGHIGVTSHSYDYLMSIIEDTEFETIMFPYNIIETKAESLFEKAKQNNIGVIVMKPLAGGAIDNGQIALKFILNNPNISVVIPGMGTIEEVQINSRAIAGQFTAEEINYIEKLRDELNGDFCRRCQYCLPCSVGIDIPSSFLIEGYYTRYNLKDWAKQRYNSMKVKPNACIECGICETKCPYDLKIITKLKKVYQVFSER
jgi:predicted aldo/keto reductase-like oxidoreductase